MRVEFHPEAMAEFRAAAEYYETQHDGLGSRFVSSIEDGYVLIVAVMHCRREPGYWRSRV